jgi:hypothetical protein
MNITGSEICTIASNVLIKYIYSLEYTLPHRFDLILQVNKCNSLSTYLYTLDTSTYIHVVFAPLDAFITEV